MGSFVIWEKFWHLIFKRHTDLFYHNRCFCRTDLFYYGRCSHPFPCCSRKTGSIFLLRKSLVSCVLECHMPHDPRTRLKIKAVGVVFRKTLFFHRSSKTASRCCSFFYASFRDANEIILRFFRERILQNIFWFRAEEKKDASLFFPF